MPGKFGSLMKNFRTSEGGAIALVVALAAIPLFGVAGFAVDFAVQTTRQADFQAAADAAVLAGVKATTEQLTSGTGNGTAKRAGKKAAAEYFNVQAGRFPGTSGKFEIDIDIEGTEVKGKGIYSGQMTTFTSQLLGINKLNITAVSEVASGVAAAVDFHLVVDVSASMGIGASASDIQTMANTIGCAFACHAPAGMTGFGDTVTQAHNAGARLRIDVVRDELRELVNKLDLARNLGNRVAIHTFSNTMQTQIEPTGDAAQVNAALQNVRLASDWFQGGTDYAEALQALATKLESDASRDRNRDRIVIILTDGVASNVRYDQPATDFWGTDPNFTVFNPVFNGDGTTPMSMQGFDERHCSALKNRGLSTVYVINTEYVIPTVGTDDDTRFSEIEANLKGNINRQLQRCASKDEYAFQAGDARELDDAIKEIIRLLELNTLRLTN
ncbi:MAG: VWA domain-containing protein [Anderseniella sp.]|nr:VWA domain-containing protein [Anderseniella sp.]